MFLEGFGVANRKKRLLERKNRSWRPSNFIKEAFCSFCSLHFLHPNDFPAKKRMKPQCPPLIPKPTLHKLLSLKIMFEAWHQDSKDSVQDQQMLILYKASLELTEAIFALSYCELGRGNVGQHENGGCCLFCLACFVSLFCFVLFVLFCFVCFVRFGLFCFVCFVLFGLFGLFCLVLVCFVWFVWFGLAWLGLFVCLFGCLFVCLFVCLVGCLFVCLFVCLLCKEVRDVDPFYTFLRYCRWLRIVDSH